MEIGTAKTKSSLGSERKRRESSAYNSGGSTSGSGKKGGGGGGNNSGDEFSEPYYFEPDISQKFNKYRLGMGLTLLVVLMTFSGLIAAYVVISTNQPLEWETFALPYQVWISTIFLLASSITYEISRIKLNRSEQISAKNWMLITTALGGMFIASQILTCIELVKQGVYLQSNPYAGFFYFLTGIHALHVLIGICALGYVLLSIWMPTENKTFLEKRQAIAKIVGWYWHFMDGIWFMLLALLIFYK